MIRYLVVLLAVSACGGPSLTGNWEGTLSQTDACSDGTGHHDTHSEVWGVVEGAQLVTLTPVGGWCGSFTGPSGANRVALDYKDCTATPRSWLERGSVELVGHGDLLEVSLEFSAFSRDGRSACSTVVAGQLNRRAP